MKNDSKSTIKDVAKEAQVSTATVSYVINNINNIKPDTREKVLAAIKKLNYTPSSTARNLARQQSRYIALITPFEEKSKRSILTENPFFQEFINGVHYKCSENGFNTTFLGIDDDEKFSNLINSGDLSGIIVLGYIGEKNYQVLSKLQIPVVLLDQEKNDNPFVNLLSSDEDGGFMATEYLINHGHKKIGFASGNFWDSSSFKYRFDGFRKALSLHNLDLNPNHIFQTEVSYDHGFIMAKTIKENINNFSALFCTSDILALGIIKGLYSYNIHVPKDISIVGFDDIKHSKFFIPGLTTVSQDIFGKGETAAQIIIERCLSPERLRNETMLHPVHFVERESVSTLMERNNS
ncbi:MAG: LacI family transcriptional regulator [Clostridium beijerinckii]|jgi:LacI family transcriptional regulator|nr:LacI family transcriptional regulator [Clostridium beijerinckii]MCI1578258.1 LacI family transcriptional regulator [Clostridium beijerinckii]MCI1583818.1 LacI family transcriptional regulator [Clostridium beijerinckii]MCI1621457.1 LacI family transcriptional regulator [Clostridium beijerinckii]